MASVNSWHPAVLVTAACFYLIELNLLTGPLFRLAALGVLLMAARYCFDALYASLLRMRVLIFVLFGVLVWQMPGRLIWPSLGGLSPSFEGALFAAEQCLRLCACCATVVLLMHKLRPSGVVDGLFQTMRGLKALGLDPLRAALRAQLVLVSLTSADRLDWRSVLLLDVRDLASNQSNEIEIHDRPWQLRDRALVFFFLVSIVLHMGLK